MFTFSNVYKKIFSHDLKRSEEESHFIKKCRNQDLQHRNLLEHYFKYLKCFIENFTGATEKAIRDYINHIMSDFTLKSENTLSRIKSQVSDYINRVLSEISPMRVTVLMSLLSDSQQNPWETVHEFYINAEPVALRQVVRLSPTHVLITIGLLHCKKLMVVSDKEYAVNRLCALLSDDCTVIASGSSVDWIALFQNTEQKAFTACLKDEAISFKSEISVFSSGNRFIRGAAYIKSNGEIIFIDEEGNVGQIMLMKRMYTPLCQVVRTTYRYISISDCGGFITLLSDN